MQKFGSGFKSLNDSVHNIGNICDYSVNSAFEHSDGSLGAVDRPHIDLDAFFMKPFNIALIHHRIMRMKVIGTDFFRKADIIEYHLLIGDFILRAVKKARFAGAVYSFALNEQFIAEA